MSSAVVGSVRGRLRFRISMLMEVKLCRTNLVCKWVTPQVSQSRIKEEQWIKNICVVACDKLWFPYH